MKFRRLKNSRDDISPICRQVPRAIVLKAPLLASKKASTRAFDKLFRMYQTHERSKRESAGHRARRFWSNMVRELERDTLKNPSFACEHGRLYFPIARRALILIQNWFSRKTMCQKYYIYLFIYLLSLLYGKKILTFNTKRMHNNQQTWTQ